MADSSTLPEPTHYDTHFQQNLDVVPKLFSDLLTNYSGIPPSQQAEHIHRLRDKAYARCPYPCIGKFRYLGLDLAAHPAYKDHVLAPLKADLATTAAASHVEPLFLDVGTCFGQDVRKLISDGALVDRLWASDIEQELVDCGFELFKDDGKLSRSRFLCPGDLLSDSPSDKLAALHDKVTILHLTTVFHLFPLEQQKMVADRCLRLLRKDIPASSNSPALLLGGQVGVVEAGHFRAKNQTHHFIHKYRHNIESWSALWDEIAARPEWKDRIKSLDVKSRLVKRVMGPEDGTIEFPEPTEDEKQKGVPLWHQFEVRVVFSS